MRVDIARPRVIPGDKAEGLVPKQQTPGQDEAVLVKYYGHGVAFPEVTRSPLLIDASHVTTSKDRSGIFPPLRCVHGKWSSVSDSSKAHRLACVRKTSHVLATEGTERETEVGMQRKDDRFVSTSSYISADACLMRPPVHLLRN